MAFRYQSLDILFIGLSITSAWGNTHAATYRGLVQELSRLGHRTLFLEREDTHYARYRDLPRSRYADIEFYADVDVLRSQFRDAVRSADVVIVGSALAEGADIAEWVVRTADGLKVFYDFNTPRTLRQLSEGRCTYLRADLIPHFDIYLSNAGGQVLTQLQDRWGAQRALPLFPSIDPFTYYRTDTDKKYDLGYLASYSPRRQARVDEFLFKPARLTPNRPFVLAGPNYPEALERPRNLDWLPFVPPDRHLDFYNQMRATLNLALYEGQEAVHVPSRRLFEAAACGVLLLTDDWPGLAELFEPGYEVLTVSSGDDVLDIIYGLAVAEREAIIERARARVLHAHTAARRAHELMGYFFEQPVS